MINAIKYMDDLVETGFTQEQSKTTVSMWMELMNENLATKSELKEVSTSLEHKMEKLELKMEKEFIAVRSETGLGFEKVQTDMKKMQLILLSAMGGLIAGATTIIGYLIKH